MKICTKISWQRMKKSSKAELIPKKKEVIPMKRAKMAHPLKRFKRFRRDERFF